MQIRETISETMSPSSSSSDLVNKVENLSSFRRSGVGGRSTAFRSKDRGISGEVYPHNDMGQNHSQYIDVSDVNPRRKNNSRQQKCVIQDGESKAGIRRGHIDEESDQYCYAYNHSVSREEPAARKGPPPTPRSVSLRDDYSQPHDRLVSTDSTQDYIEPYQSEGGNQNPEAHVMPPDPGGFYELAKDVAALHQTQDKTDADGGDYNHILDITGCLRQTSISDPQLEESYDHLDSWPDRVRPLTSTDSANEQFISAESSPMRKCSNVSDDVFAAAMSKTSPSVYRDLPANYEEPWDSEVGQKRFDRLMNRAEKRHDSRESIDQSVQGVTRKNADQSNNKSANVKKLADQTASKVDVTGATELYETAWADSSQRKTVETPLAPPVQHKPHVPSNYEDAWDLPEKQKEFEEKLLQARKQRASHGQIRDESVETAKTVDTSSRLFSCSSPTLRRAEADRVMRSDSCRSLGALAEKIDKTVALEEQNFYHGAIKRSAAERTLIVFKEGSYLVRRSETCKKDFSLTLKGFTGQPMHMKIACKGEGRYVLGENSPPFHTIPEMVDYYTSHELPVQNADRICLLYPIPC